MRATAPLSRSIHRLGLTTKQAPNKGGYYKGTGTGAMGRHTKHGGYIIDWRKVRTYVVPPGLKDCKVRVKSLLEYLVFGFERILAKQSDS